MSRRGLTLIELIVVLAIIGLLLAFMLPAIHRARESARRAACANNLRQIGVAMYVYVSDHGCFPAHMNDLAHTEKATLLPYIGMRGLYNSMNLSLHPQTDANQTVWFYRIDTYFCPSQPSVEPFYGPSSYPYCSGSGVFGDFNAVVVSKRADGVGWGGCVWPSECTDGLSQTATHSEQIYGNALTPLEDRATHPSMGILYYIGADPPTQSRVMELCEGRLPAGGARGVGVPWLQQNRYTHLWSPGRHSCLGLGTVLGDTTSPITANSGHGGGVNLLLADSHVRFVSNSIDVVIWRALGSRHGAEQLTRTAW